jgi:membrane protein required for colicin V production
MSLNWLDIVLIIIIAITFILGLSKGLIRQAIGIVAVIIGLILALNYYALAAEFFLSVVRREALAQFLGFLVIFVLVLCLGWLVSSLLSELMKGPFKFVNHALGGGLGLIKGILICGILLFAMLVFPVSTKALRESELAPYCLRLTKAVFALIPEDLKDRFSEAYQDIVGKRGSNEKRV